MTMGDTPIDFHPVLLKCADMGFGRSLWLSDGLMPSFKIFKKFLKF